MEPGSRASTARPHGRRRRVLLMSVALLVLVGAGVGLWLLRDQPLPRACDVVPVGGEWLVVDAPRGLLDEELAAALLAGHAHLTGDGAPFEDHGLGADAEYWVALLLRSRPWRLVIWRDAERGTLVCLSTGGLGSVLEFAGADERERTRRVGGHTVWLALAGSSLLMATDPELITAVRRRLGSASTEWVTGAAGLRCEARLGGGPLAHDLGRLLEWPAGTQGLVGHLRPASAARWILDLELAGSVAPPRGDGPVLPGLWKLLEEENVAVTRTAPPHIRDDGVTVRWQLAGVERAFAQLVAELHFWSTDPVPAGAARQR